MSQNIDIVFGMKFYPYLVLNGTLLRLSENKLKVSFDKKIRNDLVKYFPKPVVIRINDEGKLKTLGEGNLIDIKDTDNKYIIVEVLIESHTVLNKDLYKKYLSQ